MSHVTDVDYEAHADAFLTGRRRITTLQCRRPQGDILRYDLVTKEFGVFGRNGFVITCFPPHPKNHGYALNVCYFCAECKRIF